MGKTNQILSCKSMVLNGKGKLLFLLLSITGNFVFANQIIILTNPSSFTRNHEIIIIKRTAFDNRKSNLFPSVKKQNKTLITQTIDRNNDGIWDDLLIEITLEPNAKDTLEITWSSKQKTAFPTFTNVCLSLRSDTNIPSPEITQTQRSRGFKQNISKPYYQMEGPGIENDKVAFRAFFDYRNGKDIYGKIVDIPVLEKVGVGSSWHEMQPWGKDILKVGNSLGAGALAVEENNQIYCLGDADTSTFQNLYEGALRAAFKLGFINWDVANAKQNGSETISITKGDFYYKNDIGLPLNKQQNLIAGIANFGIDKVVYKKHNAQFSSISTYGKQAEGETTNLGLAIMFISNDYVANKTAGTASIIPNTSYVSLKSSNKKAIYFFACWEKTDTRFATQQGFEKYLEETANKLASPILVTIINHKK